MPGFIGAIERTLFVLLGLISEKKQEPKVWNRFAEFSILIASSLARSKKQFLIVMLLLPFNRRGLPEISTNRRFSITRFDCPVKFFAPEVGNER